MDLITEIIDQVTESICPCHNNTMDLITEIIDQLTDARVFLANTACMLVTFFSR
jgi:hypothetical protein